MEKIRIGILTLPLSNNYGGILQAAALYDFLGQSGFEPTLIRRQHTTRNKSALKRLLSANPFWRLVDPANTAKRFRQDKNLTDFINGYFLNKTEKCFCSEDLIENTKDIDCFVVGSDQVWRLAYSGKAYRDYFLEFVSGGRPKIAYGASFGLDKWEGSRETELEISGLLSSFRAVSVREIHAVSYLKEVMGIESTHVLDPTFLVDKGFYYKIMEESVSEETGRVFNYVLDQAQEKQRLVSNVSDILNIGVSTIDLNSSSWGRKPSIGEWLRKIFNAEFVVTDSFHGMVFSIIFNKPFLAIANKDRGYARFQSLISAIDLETRLVSDLGGIDYRGLEGVIKSEIDYDLVNTRIDVARSLSRSFLLDNLSLNNRK